MNFDFYKGPINNLNSLEQINVEVLIQRVKSSKYKELITEIGDCETKEERNTLKKRLDYVTVGGIFEKRSKKNLKQSSGLLCLDFDSLKKEKIIELQERLRNDEYVNGFFISPSGNGLKVIVKIPVCDSEEYSRRFLAVGNYFQETYDIPKVAIDNNTKDISRATFLSYDPYAFCNKDSKIYKTLDLEPISKEKFTDQTRSGKEWHELCKLIKKGLRSKVGLDKEKIFNQMNMFSKWKEQGKDYQECSFKNALEHVIKQLEERKLLEKEKEEKRKAQKNIIIPEDFKPISKEEWKRVIDANFPGLYTIFDACLSLVCLHRLKKYSDPVNINLVGVPSGQKTTVLSCFYGINGLIYKSDSLTPKSFVSHANKKDEDLADIDLLPRIKDQCLIVPELAPLFGKRREDLIETIAIMTRVFDGEGLQTDSGSKGRRGYYGEYLFTMLGATTPLSKPFWNISGKMGSRMFFLRMPERETSYEELAKITNSGKHYGDKIKECKNATHRLVYSIFNDTKKRVIRWDDERTPTDVTKVIVNCARLLSYLRASISVWNDNFEEKVNFETPLIEKPHRIVNIFMNVAKGHAISEGRIQLTIDDVAIMPLITMSTMSEDRFQGFRIFLSNTQKEWKISEISRKMKCSEKVARKTLRTLELLDIIDIENRKVIHGQSANKSLYYRLKPEVRNWIEEVESCFPKNDLTQSVFMKYT